MINYIEYLDVPVKVGIIVIAAVLVMQLVVEFLEFKGKVVPEFLKIRSFFSAGKKKRKKRRKL